MVDRRGLLIAGAAGLSLPGCGSSRTDTGAGRQPSRDERTATEIQGDIELVNGVLDLELRAVSHYRRLRRQRALFATLLEHEDAHATRLRAAVQDLGGRPVLGLHPRAPLAGAPLELARRIEETQIAAYLDALPKISDPDLRELLATIAGTEAQHLAAVDGALGADPAPKAFVTGRRAL